MKSESAITTKQPNRVCTYSLKILGDYWTVMIISQLAAGPARFGDLREHVENINTATLTTRLKRLQEYGMITRTERSRADVTYELDVLGKQALPVIESINGFSDFAKLHMKNSEIRA